MAGKTCKVINPLNSGFKLGQVFGSKTAAARALTKVGDEVVVETEDGDQLKFWRTNKMLFSKPWSDSPTITHAPRPGRTGRTDWVVRDAGNSNLKVGRTFSSKRGLVREMGNYTNCIAEDMATGQKHRFSLAGRMFRVEPV